MKRQRRTLQFIYNEQLTMVLHTYTHFVVKDTRHRVVYVYDEYAYGALWRTPDGARIDDDIEDMLSNVQIKLIGLIKKDEQNDTN